MVSRMVSRIFLATVTMIALVVLATSNVQAAPLQSVVDICMRTDQGETAILAEVSGATCLTITDTQLAGITHLVITGNTNLSIKPGDFAGLTGLIDLNISRNGISTLDEDIFDGLTNLTTLDIYDNKLDTLPSDIFHDLTKLTFLDIFDNDITTLPQDIFDHTPKLASIRLLYNNLIRTLHEDIFDGLTKLETLQINSNELTALDPDIFDGLTDLRNLQLDSNNLTELPEEVFEGLSSLEKLDLYGNRIFEIHPLLFEPLDDSLQTLNMYENFLTELPDAIFEGLTGIKRLNLRCNSLTEFQLDLLDPFAATITYLNISTNDYAYEDQPDMDAILGMTDMLIRDNLKAGGYGGRIGCNTPRVPEVTVNFGSATYTLPEGGTGTVTVTVTLSPNPERKVTVHIITTNQGGAMDTDHSGIPSQLDFNFGETSKTFTIAAEPNDIDDDGKSILLTFDTNLPTQVNPGDATTITIEDDENPRVTVQFIQDAYTVPEGGSQTITVSLSVDPERPVDIPITATGQQVGTTSDDYSVPEEITFQAGQTSQTFTFMATDDTEDDDDESVLIEFGTGLPDRMNTGTLSSTTVSITDNDDPEVTVSFEADTYTVPEGETQSITVSLSVDPERTVVVPITATDQNNATTADYSGVPDTITFNTGETSQTFTFMATDDMEDDDDESVLLAFGSRLPDRVSPGTPTQTIVSITDDDDPEVTVSFGANTYTVPEGGTQSITVSLNVDPEREVTILLTATDQGSATPADYSGVPASVTFNTGETSKTFTFMATEDTEDDDDESVRQAGAEGQQHRVSTGARSSTTVSIIDNDHPEVTVYFGADTYTVPEGGSQTITVNLSANPERTVDISITATDQNNTTSGDYSVPNSITFNTGETSKTFEFSATEDTEDDDDESVLLTFGTSLPDRMTPGSTHQTIVSITDNDDPEVTVSFSEPAYTVPEGGSQTITVNLSADPERTVTISISKVNLNGALSPDYNVPASVIFASGDTEETITFTATQDDVDDDGEKVRLGFSSLASRVTGGTTTETTVSITDDDDPQVAVFFGAATYTVAEGRTASITITLSADPERTVIIPLEKANQDMASDLDYSGVPANVTFSAGDISKSFTFTATQDMEDDDGESVKLSFDTLPIRISEGSPNETTVEITDDDHPTVTVGFESDTYTVDENDKVTITIILSADPERTVIIPLEKANQDMASDLN